jgi:hypothetical protein
MVARGYERLLIAIRIFDQLYALYFSGRDNKARFVSVARVSRPKRKVYRRLAGDRRGRSLC